MFKFIVKLLVIIEGLLGIISPTLSPSPTPVPTEVIMSTVTPTPDPVLMDTPTPSRTPTPSPNIEQIIQQITELKEAIASYTPEPTPTPIIIYVIQTPVPTPIVGAVEPTPTQTPMSTPTPVPTPHFLADPYVVYQEKQPNGDYDVVVQVDYSESMPVDANGTIYKAICMSPDYPNGVHVATSQGADYGDGHGDQLNTTKRKIFLDVRSEVFGNYTCWFVFPSGESNKVSFTVGQ